MDLKTRRTLFELHSKHRVGVSIDYTAFTSGIDEGIRVKQDEIDNLKAQLLTHRYLLRAAQQENIDAQNRNVILNKLNEGLLKALNTINKG